MLISLLVFLIIAGLVYYLLTLLPLPAPFKNAVLAVFIVICILYLIGFIAPLPWSYSPHRLP